MTQMLYSIAALFWTTAALTATAPGIIGGDAPELTTAAFHLGSAHAPGYPLYVTLGHLFQFLPVGTPAFRMTLLSITVQTIAFIVLAKSFSRLLGNKVPAGERDTISIGTACLVMAGPLVFRQFISPEVMALQFLLTALLLRFLLFPEPSKLLLVGFLSGLSLGNHHLTLLILPAFAWAYRRELKDFPRLLGTFGFLLIGLSIYLVLPLRAVQLPLANWGNPASYHSFLFHVIRGQYGGDITSGSFLNGFRDLYLFLKSYFFELPIIGTLLLIAGAWKNRTGFRTEYFVGAAGLFILFPFLIRAPYEPENNYVNEAFLPLSILWLSPLVLKGMQWIHERSWVPRKWFTLGLLILFTFVLFTSHRKNDSTRDLSVEDVNRNILVQMPSRAVLFSEGDAVTFPLSYLKLVLGLRPDLSIFDRMGGLFQDIYRSVDYRKGVFLSPSDLVMIEKEYLGKNQHSAVFYSESSTVPGIPLTMTGLLFRSLEREQPIFPEDRQWDSFREPRVALKHDYFSRETAARYHLFKATYDLDRRGKVALGIQDVDMAKRLAHDNSRLWINAGVLESDHGWIDQAALTFEMASRLTPGNFLAWYDRGVTAEKQIKTNEAITYLQKAIELNPGYAQSHHHLGFQYYQAKRFDEAAQEWETTRRLDPSYPESYRNLGFMYLQSRPDQAVQMFERYILLYPNSPHRPEIEKILASQRR